jgi:molecular chaperone DnaJ
MDLYILLGVQRGASSGEIKRAYRRLARRYHPDINPGDREAASRFRQVLEAYETLIDPDRRRRYDSGQPLRMAAEPSAYGFTGFDFSSVSEGDRATTFGDLFEDVFARRGDRAGGNRAEHGADLHFKAQLTFDEAWHGFEWPISITRQEACRSCAGSGYHRTVESRCLVCEGTGVVRSVRGHMVFTKNCPHCGGTGRLRQLACETCQGQGVETRAESLTVRIPPGIAHGSRVRVPGKGHAGVRGGAPGDLYLDVEVRPHPLYQRDGDDIHMTVPIAIHEAALGARVQTPTPDGAIRLRVPPGTQSGQRFRLRERGVPSPRGGRRGDLVIEVRIVLPRLLDERSKELLREFGRINGESVRDETFLQEVLSRDIDSGPSS